MSRDEPRRACCRQEVIDAVHTVLASFRFDLTVAELVELAIALDLPAADLLPPRGDEPGTTSDNEQTGPRPGASHS